MNGLGWKPACIAFVFLAATVIGATAQTFTNLATFARTNGAYPYGVLVQGLDGNLYGTTYAGARNICGNGCGTVFKITPSGDLTTVHEFVGTDGSFPYAGLILATDGNFYGTTSGDASQGNTGTVFRITSAGTVTVLAAFSGLANSPRPYAPLMQDTVDGNFYGSTFAGGQGDCPPWDGCGTIFKITAAGALTTLHEFCRYKLCSDGAYPTAVLVQASNGVLFGTTSEGGVYCGYGEAYYCGEGTAFSIGTGGTWNLLHEFATTDDSALPIGGIILGDDGNYYGTTEEGGPASGGTIFGMTPEGAITTLHGFNSAIDGSAPVGGLLLATDGNFYGTTSGIGMKGTCTGTNCGTIFQMTPEGTVTTLHIFDQTDGVNPTASLMQGTDGNLYGTTNGFVGNHLYGTVFKLSMGLAPFVKTVPTAANPGTTIFILGTDLTGATSVTFNGKAATFTVVSATEITATVPTGSTTGTVQVVTPGGTLSSNGSFRVF